ncbi:MAG TPA: trypsin-like peptidase domain-containing protein [Thermoguttaceae bacterium]|nr:trypsin-like peptidase domain-containing protein [Thermoguttaceae bacterium]
MHPLSGILLRRCRYVAAWLLLLGLAAGVALAQTPATPVSKTQGMPSEEAQAKLYEQLDAQTEFLRRQSEVIKTVAKLVGPAVVHIEADVDNRRSLQHGQNGMVEEAGSGVIIRGQGKHKDRYYVLTNRHVIRGAGPESIRVTLADQRMIHPLPLRVWEDPETDVAVMEIEAPYLVPARIGKSGTVEIGDFVLAVGSPFGLSHSVTFGIVSAKNRRALQLGGTGVRFQDFIQTDAAINPGNSGGPLINLRGEVIGINTAIASNSGGSEGIGFAIPSDMFMHAAGQLIEKGKVDRAFLGVTLEKTFNGTMAAQLGLPRPMGALVKELSPDSPAAAAKLRPGDVILAVESTPVMDDNHLVNLISFHKVGEEVALTIFRDREEMTVKTQLAPRPAYDAQQ